MHLPVAAGAQRVEEARDAHGDCIVLSISQAHTTPLNAERKPGQGTRKKTCEKLGACNCRTFHRPRLLPWESQSVLTEK